MISALTGLMILSMVAAGVLRLASQGHGGTFHAAAWQETLMASEAGVDIAINTLRTSLSSTGAWSGWSSTDAGGNAYPNNGRLYSPPDIVHDGEGANRLAVQILVEALASQRDADGAQWYRIRSIGTAELPGPMRLGTKQDVRLRRMSLLHNSRTHAAVPRPEVSRLVEVMAKPKRRFDRAITAEELIEMKGNAGDNLLIDSYDSSDPSKSTNGEYDPNKAQQNGDIATNGDLINVDNANVYGSASTNDGAVTLKNNGDVSGGTPNDFYEPLPLVEMPVWTSINVNPNLIKNTTSLAGGSTSSSPARYKLSTVALKGGDTLTLTSGSAGQSSYYEIWITGDMTTGGGASIVMQPGVHVTFYVEGDIDIGGGGILNSSHQPINLGIYSIRPYDSHGDPVPVGSLTSADIPTVKIHGDASFYGTFYGPTADVTLSGGGNSESQVFGSFVGRTISMNGNVQVHYDELLGNNGPVSDYQVASWFEDDRDHPLY
jgi:hypothetical protein